MKIVCRKPYQRGRIPHSDYGEPLGWATIVSGKEKKRFPIINAGLLQIGIRTYFIGVIVGRREIFLGVRGRLWVFPGRKLSIRVSSPELLDARGKRQWADMVARDIGDKLTTVPEAKATHSANIRYRKIVKALVNKRIVDAASLGYTRTARHYARGICEAWREFDLLKPAAPDTKHALMVSLVLALEADEAAQLIEFGSLLEHRIPLMNREISLTVYQRAVTLLSRLCPEWWGQGFTTDWNANGSIERTFRNQYVRMINESNIRDIPIDMIGGLCADDMNNILGAETHNHVGGSEPTQDTRPTS